jgi:predicted ATP-grasp superfamily ATP-dependent carboligase
MLERAAVTGLPIPETRWPSTMSELEAILPELVRYPYIIKPAAKFEWRDGVPERNMGFFAAYGSKALRARDAGELRERFRDARGRGFTVLVQEEIEGPTERLTAVDFYADPRGRITAYHMGRKLRQFPSDFGTCTLGQSARVEGILPLCRRFVEAVGFWGIGNMEFKERDGVHFLMEINPRPWMWIQLATAAGVNLPHLAHLDLCGMPGPAEGRARAAGDWVDLRVDLLHLGRRNGPVAREPVTFWRWLRSLSQVRVEARSTRADPAPVLDALYTAFRRRATFAVRGRP